MKCINVHKNFYFVLLINMLSSYIKQTQYYYLLFSLVTYSCQLLGTLAVYSSTHQLII